MSQLNDMLQFARNSHIPVMLDDTAKLLQQTVLAKQPSKILEVGTAIGYSGIIMLTACPKATLNTIEKDEHSIELARANFQQAGVYDRVNIFEGDACDIVRRLTGSYDMIFLDGPKGQYDEFLPFLKSVLNVGGVLFCDNVLYKGLVENLPDKRHKHITIARNLQKFLANLTSDKDFDTQLHRIGDGVTVSVRVR